MTTRRSRLRNTALGVLLVTLLAGTASAQFVVFDPTNYANALLRYTELQAQLTQLINTYFTLRAQYALLFKQATRLPFNLASRYFEQRTPWRPMVGTSTYGITAPWINAANTGIAAAAAFRTATEPLTTFGNALQNAPALAAAHVRERYDRAQLQDGALTTSLEAIGRLRLNEVSVENALRTIEADSYADNDDLHTQIAVLNKINAAGVTAARMTKDTNYLLVSLLEQQLLDATERRDATVQALNAQAAFYSQAKPLLDATTVETTNALTRFRIP